ncbi:hypothetical protein ACQPW1_38350 [Nocardia sp. CA-128927]|uniref:hypothetical protein n=1 Tax=Nocardia sp. CA-128927 TaxID=3239975 RepID=UPI003D975E84
MNVSDAVAGGDQREILIALRRTVAEAIDNNPAARDLAALVRAQLNIDKELSGLDAGSSDNVPADLKELQERTKRKRGAVIL